MDRSRASLKLAVGDVDFELQQLVDLAQQGDPPTATLSVASLESALLHVRNLFAFLDSGKEGWITIKDYLPTWSPPKSEALKRLRTVRDLLNAHLSHLTWDRVTGRAETEANPAWNVWELADDVLTVFTQFVGRLQEVDEEAAGWFAPALQVTSLKLRGEWPTILPKPPPGSPLLVRVPAVKGR